MNIPKEDYIAYLEAIDAQYTEEIVDVIYSENNEVINETFHSSLTLCHEGEIYTIYDLAEVNSLSRNTGEALSDIFPEEKIAELYNNIQAFNNQYNLSVPSVATDLYVEMSIVVDNVSID